MFSPVRSALSKVGHFSPALEISLRTLRMIIGSIAYINTLVSLALGSSLAVSVSLLSCCDCVFRSTALCSFVITRWSKQIRKKRAECKENSCYVSYIQNPFVNKQTKCMFKGLNLAIRQLESLMRHCERRLYLLSVVGCTINFFCSFF